MLKDMIGWRPTAVRRAATVLVLLCGVLLPVWTALAGQATAGRTPGPARSAMPMLPTVASSPAFPVASPTADFEPYVVPPQPPAPRSKAVRALLKGSRVTTREGWIVVRLSGSPYRIGFQNGYHTAQSADYWIRLINGEPGSASRRVLARIARDYMWGRIPTRYQKELRGVRDGMRAAGYPVSLWQVVAANGWADVLCYAKLLPTGVRDFPDPAAKLRRGGCSAFIATGDATADGSPVAAHTTWTPGLPFCMFNVLFRVHPDKGYDLAYQSAGGQIWSGVDWYQNSAGLLLTETSLPVSDTDPRGTPVFTRVRKAAQFSDTVGDVVRTLLKGNNGCDPAEWLMGDSSGRIASLQVGCGAYDLSMTRSGFFGSANFPWGPAVRRQCGADAPPYEPADMYYARFTRWSQLSDQYYGRITARVAKTLIADTYDTYLERWGGNVRTICGKAENGTTGIPYSGNDCWGSVDAKVATSRMARDGLRVWARWGRPDGAALDAVRFLRSNPDWQAENGPLATFSLLTFSAQTPNQWTVIVDMP